MKKSLFAQRLNKSDAEGGLRFPGYVSLRRTPKECAYGREFFYDEQTIRGRIPAAEEPRIREAVLVVRSFGVVLMGGIAVGYKKTFPQERFFLSPCVLFLRILPPATHHN